MSGAVDHEAVIEDAMSGVADADYVSHFELAEMGVGGLKDLAKALVVRE